MKRTPLKRKTPLKAKVGLKKVAIKQISNKKQKNVKTERNIWGQILVRCQGFCEYCGNQPDFRGLHPHEEVFRSHGGKLTLENTKASCGKCHSRKHGIKEV